MSPNATPSTADWGMPILLVLRLSDSSRAGRCYSLSPKVLAHSMRAPVMPSSGLYP